MLPETTTVLVVDDHLTVGEALALTIGAQADLACVGVARTQADALALVAEHRPDVVLMDVRLPDGDGIEATERVKAAHPETRVLCLTAFADIDTMARAAQAGACGFLPKDSPVSSILEAIRSARDDGLIVGGSALSGVLARMRESGGTANRGRRITPRERDVLRLMSQGKDPRAISGELGLTISTTRSYIKSILGKLGAHSQLEAVVVATREKIIPAT